MPLLVGLAAALLLLLSRSVSAQDVLVFRDVSVVPMNGLGTRPNQTVIIRDGIIEAIAPADRVIMPAEATVLEATGHFLAPGLMSQSQS